MNINKIRSYKYWGRRIRSMLFPIHKIDQHFGQITRSTSKELGFHSILIEEYDKITRESCLDMNFVEFEKKESV